MARSWPNRISKLCDTTTPDGDVRGFSFALELGAHGLELHAKHRPDFGPVVADWLHPDVQRRIAAGKRQPLARAVGLHKFDPSDGPLTVLDATAGLGRDGYTLAALGSQVTLVERNETVVQLLRNALGRAASDPRHATTAQRLEVLSTEAGSLLKGERRWDVIYLDPMYPDDGKTALPRKEMQVLRDLTGGDSDAADLLAPAISNARLRVVVKRSIKAPWLADLEPSMYIASTQLRFDVYMTGSRFSSAQPKAR